MITEEEINCKNNLGDVTIIITSQDKAETAPDEEVPEEYLYYPITRVYRYDFLLPADNIEDFIKHVESHAAVDSGGQLKNSTRR